MNSLERALEMATEIWNRRPAQKLWRRVMGSVRTLKSSGDFESTSNTDPNPSEFRFGEVVRGSCGCECDPKKATLLLVQYPNCINFNGYKLLVYSGELPDTEKIDRLDPHFADNGSGPVARFVPTNFGYSLARATLEELVRCEHCKMARVKGKCSP